jgi:hypothetical protein
MRPNKNTQAYVDLRWKRRQSRIKSQGARHMHHQHQLATYVKFWAKDERKGKEKNEEKVIKSFTSTHQIVHQEDQLNVFLKALTWVTKQRTSKRKKTVTRPLTVRHTLLHGKIWRNFPSVLDSFHLGNRCREGIRPITDHLYPVRSRSFLRPDNIFALQRSLTI